MTTRPLDTIRAEAVGVGSLDRFTSAYVANDLTQPAEAGFEVGDDGTWNDLENYIAPGTEYRVFVNDRLRLSGRVEVLDAPVDVDGAVCRFTVRTKLSDACYASAHPATKIKDVTVKQFILELFDPLGFKESDFVFDADVSRNLMTGLSKTTGAPKVDLEPLKEDQARVNPPESIMQAAQRHLSRHGYMLWDAADGKIVIGAPNDQQDPIYDLRMFRGGQGQINNILSATRTRDWSELATTVGVFGVGKWGASTFLQAPFKAVTTDDDMLKAGFYRPILILNEALRTEAMAQRQAARELTNRSLRKDSWDFVTDGLSFWDGSEQTQWAIDAVANVAVEVAGGPVGPYLVHRVELRRDAQSGDASRISAVKQGIWKL